MILILCEKGTEQVGQEIGQALRGAYEMPTLPELVMPDAVWTREPEWDDLLIVVYAGLTFSQEVQKYIQAFRNSHTTTEPGQQQPQPGGFVVPVATNPAHLKPPNPISGIKAALYDGTEAAKERIIKAAGVFLGLAVRPGNQHIFVLYRATDGALIARDIYDRFKTAGFQAWSDELRRVGSGMLPSSPE